MDDYQGRSGRAARQAALKRLVVAVLANLVFAGTATASDVSEHVGAELLVLAGDARRLANDPIGAQERAGLNDRLKGALAYLPLLLRRAGGDAQVVASLREMLARNDLQQFGRIAKGIALRYRFMPGWMSRKPDRDLIARGAELHREFCSACHEAGWGDIRLPAKQLKRLASVQSGEEFGARLWLGVRGTREVAYANPFDDEELAALFVYYRSPR